MRNRAGFGAIAGLVAIATLAFIVARSSAGGIVGMEWVQIGPQPLEIDAEQNYQGNGPDSGEVADIAIDPRGSTDQIIFVATEAGGIWQSTDGGGTWKTTFDQNESLSMGAVVLDPANPSIVYAGTGNPTNTGFFNGVGVYKSTDDGQTWTLTPMSSGFGGVAIVRMVMPATKVLLTGTQGGLALSTDGGNSFTLPLINGVTNSQINDLRLDTATPTTVYASVQNVGIFMSTDSGADWGSNLFTASNGSPLSVANFTPGFISFAQTTQPNNSTIYASVQNTNSSGAPPNWGLFVSTNGGASWAQASANNNPSNNCSQCGYDQTIGVDPLDGTVVYLGFVDMWVSTDSGANFSEIGHGQVHNDHHALTLSPHTATATPGHVPFWDGSDGGVALATNQGGTFTAENGPNPGPGQAIASNLFRNLDIGRGSSNNNKFTYGGLQDTGSAEFGDLDTPNTWHLHIDGDGAGTAVDPCNATNAVIMDDACLQYNHGNDPPSWSGASFPSGNFGGLGFSFGNTVAYDQQCSGGADNGVYASITEWPKPGLPGQGCFGQGSPVKNEIFKSTDGGASYAQWPTASSTFPSAVAVIATVKLDPNVVWIGLNDGTLQVSTNATAASPSIAAPAAQPTHIAGASVTAISIDPTNTQTVVVTYSGFCGASCNNNRNRHVFLTNDGGATWTDITGTAGGGTNNLPDLPVHAVVIDPSTSPHTIVVSNDAGVVQTADQGTTWQVLGLGMPNVDVVSLALDSSVTPEVLRAGTFGRSAFQLGAATGPLLAINTSPNFGILCPNQSPTTLLQLFNVGATDLTINNIQRTSGSTDFAITGPQFPVTIKPGEEVDWTITATITSSSTNPESAVFTIASNDSIQPNQQVTYTATVGSAQGGTVIANGGNFGNVCVGSFADLDLTVSNKGTCSLVVSNITSNDADFLPPSTLNYPLSIVAGNSIAAPVRFEPLSFGTKNGIISVPSNSSSGLMSVNVTGNAQPGKITTSGAGNFGNVCAGSNATESITVSNTGPCDLKVTGASINCSDFTIQGNPFPATLSADSSLPLTIAFTPTSGGTKSCTLTITSDDPANPSVTVPLTATTPAVSIDVPPDAAPLGYNFPATVIQSVGACSSSNPFPVSNNGICPVNINSVVISGANGADYSLGGLPSLSTPLGAGQILGQGNLQTIFKPTLITRAEQGTVTVTYESDPITHATTSVPRALCGEGTSRGVRVLVTAGGVPLATVDKIQLSRVGGNRKGISVDNVNNATLQTVSQTAPCASFQFHYEWGGVTNPIQLTAGDYQITVSATVNGKKKSQTISFMLGTCSFNQNIVVAF